MAFFFFFLSLSSSGSDIVFSCRRHGFDSRRGYLLILGRFQLVFIDRVDLYASGSETRCSAVWSAHLFWVQRAIGSNPVTLMSFFSLCRSARHSIYIKKREERTTVWLWHMRWRVWLGNIMAMYRTANPGMTVRPRPWPLLSVELLKHLSRQVLESLRGTPFQSSC